nr:protein cereblon isoform X1 [Hydra vulgaris]
MNNQQAVKDTIKALQGANGKTTQNSKDIADILNKIFQAAFVKEDDDSEDSLETDSDLPDINDSAEDLSDDSQHNSEENNEGESVSETSENGVHSYMGSGMNELSGRQIHEEGAIITLPLFYQAGIIIVPGQILPLNLFHPQPIDMMEKVVASDKTFGLVIKSGEARRDEADNGGVFLASVGVTCEIFSFREYEEYGYKKLSLKAQGRQRFKILSKSSQLDGVIMGTVEILPETIYSHPPSSLVYTIYQHPSSIRSQVIANCCYLEKSLLKNNEQRYMAGFQRRTVGKLCSSLTHLPGWVYKFYNSCFLMDCLVREIRSWNDNLEIEKLPTNPVEFSYWMTANLPLTMDMKIDLLKITSASMRMQKLLGIMRKCGSSLACASCESIITDKKELFCLSERSPMAAYVNSYGYVHETATFYKASNISLTGRPSTEYSWFPGYAWTIALCKCCHKDLGWKFTATHKGLTPSKFWGLTRKSLKPIFKDAPTLNEPSE